MGPPLFELRVTGERWDRMELGKGIFQATCYVLVFLLGQEAQEATCCKDRVCAALWQDTAQASGGGVL